MCTNTRLFALRGDCVAGQECFIFTPTEVEQTVAEENLRMEEEENLKIQPQGEYELFGVDHDHLDKQTQIRKSLPELVRSVVQAILIEF